MSRGNEIIVSANPQGKRVEGTIASGQTPLPGTIYQYDFASGLDGNGRWTWTVFDADANGGRPKGPIIVLIEDHLQGKGMTDAYAAGDHAFGYIPLPGDELNCLLRDITGTGDDHTAGEILIIHDGTGLLIATASTPETEPFALAETVTDPTANTLAHVVYTGY